MGARGCPVRTEERPGTEGEQGRGEMGLSEQEPGIWERRGPRAGVGKPPRKRRGLSEGGERTQWGARRRVGDRRELPRGRGDI